MEERICCFLLERVLFLPLARPVVLGLVEGCLRKMGESEGKDEGKWGLECQRFFRFSDFLCRLGASDPLGLPAWTAIFEEFVPSCSPNFQAASFPEWSEGREEKPDCEARFGFLFP